MAPLAEKSTPARGEPAIVIQIPVIIIIVIELFVNGELQQRKGSLPQLAYWDQSLFGARSLSTRWIPIPLLVERHGFGQMGSLLVLEEVFAGHGGHQLAVGGFVLHPALFAAVEQGS